MATEKPQAPEGFAPAAPANDSEDESDLNLDAGEEMTALVLQITEDEGEYGKWFRLKLKDVDGDRGVVNYFAKDEVKRALKADRIAEGDQIWLARDVTERSIGDDGDSYLPTFCHVMEDN